MNRFTRWLSISACVMAMMALCATSALAASPKYVITNDDNSSTAANTASVYSIGASGALTLVKTISTGRTGGGGGYYAAPRTNVLRSKTQNCAYVGDAYSAAGYGNGPGDVAAIDMDTLSLVGTFAGFPLDTGGSYGIGLAENSAGTFLFTAYSGSGTIVTYAQQADCKLKRLGEVITVGARDGLVDGMKVTPSGNALIVGYSDGSIGSYKINSNGALSLIGRYLVTDGGNAGGVDITQNGKWALFGDATGGSQVEVAPIKVNGGLGPTVGYAGIGSGSNSNIVWLSPDETLVYVSNNVSGTIAAAPFDAKTGVINTAKSCTSSVLKGKAAGNWLVLGGIATGSTVGTGSPVYAAEYGGGNPSGIGIIAVKATKSGCVLTETKASPASDASSTALLSVGVDPPRSF
jgi:hypothetical protein